MIGSLSVGASIPALDHEVFKYCGYVHPLNETFYLRMFERYGASKQPAGPSESHKVLSFNEYKSDRITEDGVAYGKQIYTPKQIILTRRESDDTIFRMLWVGKSSPKDEQAAREYATKDGWLIHFARVGDENAWDTCRERHIEIEAGQKELDIRQP